MSVGCLEFGSDCSEIARVRGDDDLRNLGAIVSRAHKSGITLFDSIQEAENNA